MRSERQEAAYVEFVAARQAHLRRLAYAISGDWVWADEIVRQALTRLYLAWPRLEREGTEESHVRRAILRADAESRGSAATDPSESWTPLFQTLQSLPSRTRKIGILRWWLGLTDAEAAEELGVSTNTVRAHAERALAAFAGSGAGPDGTRTTAEDLRDRLEDSIPDGPPLPPVEDQLAAARRTHRRRRRATTVGSAVALLVLAVAPALLQQTPAPAGGGIDNRIPLPVPTFVPTPVHLLVAPPRFVRPDTPPVLYLFGRMFRRDSGVTVLATFGEIDVAQYPQGGAIVREGGRTSWVLVVGNEPERLDEQRAAPYDYQAFTAWAVSEFPILSGRLALAATAPGRYRAPTSDAAAPAAYDGDQLVAKPGGVVVERIQHPPADRRAVRPCHDQAVRVHTASGDWFVLGYDCAGQGALYSEPVGVRADTLTSWLTQVKKAQARFVH